MLEGDDYSVPKKIEEILGRQGILGVVRINEKQPPTSTTIEYTFSPETQNGSDDEFPELLLGCYLQDIKYDIKERSVEIVEVPGRKILDVVEKGLPLEYDFYWSSMLNIGIDASDIFLCWSPEGKILPSIFPEGSSFEIEEHLPNEMDREKIVKYFDCLDTHVGANFEPVFERIVEFYKECEAGILDYHVSI